MNEIDIAMKKTDDEWISALFIEGMTDKQKYDKITNLYFITHNSEYCESMAGEFASGNSTLQY